ncbi:MAG: UPF0158 family protein [Deferribacteraceae bacterium]|jgi:hypothetical protein|nr:UPF0158 family protein [Deferribacteraceae bacterium]
MKKLSLDRVADEFTMIGEHGIAYNPETGEFINILDPDFIDEEDYDQDKELEGCISCPEQFDLHEYSIMEDFIESRTKPREIELLSVAIRGKGAFRRFKDVLYQLEIEKEWFAYQHEAFKEIAKRWCEENKLEYE